MRRDAAIAAAPDVHLAVLTEALHALPVAANGELDERAVLAQQAQTAGHDAAPAVGAHDKSCTNTLRPLAAFAHDAHHVTDGFRPCIPFGWVPRPSKVSRTRPCPYFTLAQIA